MSLDVIYITHLPTSTYTHTHTHTLIANAEGKAEFHLEDKHLRLMGAHSVIGRSIIVKAQEDDLGRVGLCVCVLMR
jgi:Cu/Zn superoxide dismutase